MLLFLAENETGRTLLGRPPALGLDPKTLVVVCALAASSAYMMPVGTPPNAIVFGTTYAQFRHSGLLGCPACYRVFEAQQLFAMPDMYAAIFAAKSTSRRA